MRHHKTYAKKTHHTFLDLFCGCGGFSLGMQKAGFIEIASIDLYHEAMTVFQKNMPQVSHAFERDLTKLPPEEFAKLIRKKHVDVVIGGPPCQGFSKTRKVDGANSGIRYIKDKRRHLYREFLKYVEYFRPKIFVMENVPGIRSAAGGVFFTRIQAEARKLGYRVHDELVRAWEYGVPQKRERQLIIGTRIDMPIFSSQLYMPRTHGRIKTTDNNGQNIKTTHNNIGVEPLVTLWEAIGDLPPLKAGKGKQISNYDLIRRRKHKSRFGGRYLYRVLQIKRVKNLTMHEARPHNKRDLRDFNRLREGETSAQVIARGKHMEFPYDRENFEDRYTRQHRNKLCSTIVAHMSKDGLMFIHPTQNRSLTPREAARIQSFPDWFQFPVTRMHQFRLIGNAVPPLVGKAIGRGIVKWLKSAEIKSSQKYIKITPRNEGEAIAWLSPLLQAAECGNLKIVQPNEFKKGWFATGFLNSQLHPDSARYNGKKLIRRKREIPPVNIISPNFLGLSYAQSGWPKRLVPIAKEAYRRFINGELLYDQYYFSKAQHAGFRSLRNKRKINGSRTQRS
jgi:DNA (cytosine-5)-methyltransferase 1